MHSKSTMNREPSKLRLYFIKICIHIGHKCLAISLLLFWNKNKVHLFLAACDELEMKNVKRNCNDPYSASFNLNIGPWVREY